MPIGFGDLGSPQASNPLAGVPESASSGIQLGMNLALQKQQMQVNQMNLQAKREEMEQRKNEHLYGILEKVTAAKDPAVKKGLVNFFARQYKQFNGTDPSEDFTDIINRSPEALGDAIKNAGLRDVTNPAQRAQSLQEFIAAAGDPEEGLKLFEGYSGGLDKQKNTETLVGGRTAINQANQAEKEKSAKELRIRNAIQKGGIGSTDQLRLIRSSDPAASEEALQRAEAVVAARSGQAADDKHTKVQSDVDFQGYRKGIMAQQLDLSKSRLSLSQQRFAEGLNKDITKDPILKSTFEDVQRGQRGLALLNGNPRWTDLSEAAADINRLITGSSRVAQSQQDKLDFAPLKRTWDLWQSKAENREVGGPGLEELALFRGRLQRLSEKISAAHDNRLQSLLSSQKASGLKGDPYLADMYDTLKQKQDSKYNPDFTKQKRDNTLPGPPPPPTVDKDGNSMIPMTIQAIGVERKMAADAIRQGADAETVKRSFKQRTGRDL